MFQVTLTKKIIGAVLALVGCVCIHTALIYAAENTFQTEQTVTDSADVVPPSVPTNVVATAISSSQINLSWTASTDNVSVAHYNIYRDSVFIGTSPTTTYSDTGLVPSTTYSYTVSAVDPSSNESAQSDPAEATTLAAPVENPVVNGPGSGTNQPGGIVLQLLYFLVSPGTYKVTMSFGTNIDVVATTQWGRTADLELGSVTSAGLQKNHNVVLENLTPDTNYYFKITLIDSHGKVHTIDNQQVRTLPLEEVAPTNVSQLTATPREKNIVLTWQNPRTHFDSIRVVRSDKFFPRDPFEGQVIYEGDRTSFSDSDVVQGTTYYYSVFTVLGAQFSSGAMTQAHLLKPGETSTVSDLFAGILELPRELISPLLAKFSLTDVEFFQGGEKLPVVSDTVDIKADRDLKISVPYEKVPEILKTIVMTMYDVDDHSKSFSFMLRVNSSKTAYEAIIAPLERPGRYTFGVAILDHKNQGLKKIAGVIAAHLPDLGAQQNPFSSVFAYGVYLLVLILVIVFLVLCLSLFRKRKTDNVPV